jgi:ribose-phosphate pyrophosphokinase
LRQTSAIAPVCVAEHGIFADGADAMLKAEGARLVTSNSVPHPTNAIDVSALLAEGVAALA